MNKQCARCSKTVYPLEELKCLDKTWHKGCFKCSECGMTLNMKTYKGFNKLPYCEAHIPKPKATTVAETPELQRLAENTKLQSNVRYHEDFEKAKGKYTTVADDPETMRIKEASKMISNVSYHGELQKKAEMESRRTLTSDDNGNPDSAQPKSDIRNGAGIVSAALSAGPASSMGLMSQRASGSPGATGVQRPGPEYDQMAAGDHVRRSQQQQHGRAGSSQSRGGGFQPPQDYYAQQLPQGQPQPNRMQGYSPSGATSKASLNLGRCYRALYDYAASDADEVSFREGDLITNCSPIEEGWMTGTVQRSKRTGMLPANYVEPAN